LSSGFLPPIGGPFLHAACRRDKCARSFGVRADENLSGGISWLTFLLLPGPPRRGKECGSQTNACESFSPLGNCSKSQQRALLGPVGWEPRGLAHQTLGAELVRLAPVDDSGGDVGR
jgi:hypothetical protein